MGGLNNYSDCLSCGNSKYAVDIAGSYRYCQDHCPTAFTAGIGTSPTCTAPGNPLIFTGTFNNFDGPWTDGSLTATASANVLPAKLRGQHFSGTNGYMTFSDFTLHFNFSVMAWVRLDDLASEYTIFSKDRGAFPNGVLFKASVNTSGYLSAALADADDYSQVSS